MFGMFDRRKFGSLLWDASHLALMAEGDGGGGGGGTSPPPPPAAPPAHRLDINLVQPTSPPAPPAPPPPPAPPAGIKTVAELETELANVRAEAAAHRISKNEAKDQAAALQTQIDQVKADVQRQVDAARGESSAKFTQLKGRLQDTAIKAEAAAAGLLDMDLIPLVDRAGITIDDDGNVAGVKEAIEKFKTAKPSYFRAAGAGGTSPPPPPPPATGQTGTPPAPAGGTPPSNVRELPKDAAGRAEYNRRKAEAIAALSRR